MGTDAHPILYMKKRDHKYSRSPSKVQSKDRSPGLPDSKEAQHSFQFPKLTFYYDVELLIACTFIQIFIALHPLVMQGSGNARGKRIMELTFYSGEDRQTFLDALITKTEPGNDKSTDLRKDILRLVCQTERSGKASLQS